jgi:hypothetical protein
MQRSLANVITVLGLAVYWMIHTGAVLAALKPFAIQAQKVGVLAKDSLELPFVGIFAAPLFLLLDFADLLDAMGQLFVTCVGLLFAAGIIGLITGRAIRAFDPYGVVSLSYVFTRSCVVAALSCVAVVLLIPRFTTSYIVLAVPALALIPLAFGTAMRAIAYPRINKKEVDDEA